MPFWIELMTENRPTRVCVVFFTGLRSSSEKEVYEVSSRASYQLLRGKLPTRPPDSEAIQRLNSSLKAMLLQEKNLEQ